VVNETEKDTVAQFKEIIENQYSNWRVQTEISFSDTRGQQFRADVRIVQVDDHNIVQRVVAYGEVKGSGADARDLQMGYAQCLNCCDLTGAEGWFILPHDQVEKFLTPDRAGKLDNRVRIYDVDERKLIGTQSVTEQKSKSRIKQKQETPLFSGWNQDYAILVTTPIALTQPDCDPEGNVRFNTGARIRGSIKEVAKTISGTLSDSTKYTLYVTPEISLIGRKDELVMRAKFIPDKRTGASAKREFYELPAPRTLKFTVNCMNPRLTPAIVEELIRKAGMFAGIGDSHSDGLHGRFRLIEPDQQ
jgi:hypothetical protein